MSKEYYYTVIIGLLLCIFGSFAEGKQQDWSHAKASSGKISVFPFTCGTLGEGAWYRKDKGIMGTNIRVELWAPNAEQGNRGIDAVIDEMERINQLMSTYIAQSEISQLNEQAAQQPYPVSKELFELIKLSVGISAETQGAFDITYASVGYLYNFRNKLKPNDAQISQLLDAIDYRHIRLDEASLSVYFAHPNVKINLGGIAKGHAVDKGLAIIKALGFQHGLITAGGDTGLLGNRCGRPWQVGIRDPRQADKQAVTIPLADMAMSTSGDYERYFEADGTRYHHIISPKSGRSAAEVQSVTIIGPKSTLNDALSTAVFVLGVKDGIDLINRVRGYEVLIVDKHRRLHQSQAFNAHD